MKLDPAIVLVVKRIAQEFKKLRRKLEKDIEAIGSAASSTPGPKGDRGPEGPRGPAGADGADGADGGGLLAYDIALTDAPATITDGFTTTVVPPVAPTIAGKTFTGLRIIRDSRAAVNITATASGAFAAATIMEYPIIHVFQVTSSLGGFAPFYHYRRIHVAGGYTSGSSTGVLSVEHSSEVKLRADDFTPDGVESITLTDLGHYLPDQVEDGVLLTWGAGTERTWERLRLEYEYTETIAALSVSEATTDETVYQTFPLGVLGSADGSFTITPSGGVGPYSLEVNGYGVLATGSGPLVVSPLAGGDYQYKVRDSLGAVYPASGWQTIHVYREAFSEQINYSVTLSIANTVWTRTANIPKYDEGTYLGTLASVELIQTASTARSTARVENLGGAAGTATTTVDVLLGVEYPAATVIATDTITITPLFVNVLGAYDGVTDYGGASGVSNARRSTAKTTAHAAALSPTSDFVGSGTVAVTFTGNASASTSGISPYSLAVTPELGLTFTVRYTVTAPRT